MYWLFLLAVNVWSMQSLLRSDDKVRKLKLKMPWFFRVISTTGKILAAFGIALGTTKLIGVM